ncbi:MAG: Hsp20/alpha crystallin family protein [Candidatus Methanofastidiosa archaeon]|nr:Hsp20/alpha crystallin family protein [Candidatus Methanofastidiosa archaeon]
MRYDPWEEFRVLQEEIDRLFGEFRQSGRRLLPSKRYPEQKGLVEYSEPLSDIIDKGDELKAIMDLPGVKKEDISIQVNEDSIEVRAERKTEKKEEKEGYFFQERGYQGYARSISLPEKVVPSESKAEYNNGVLEISMKKATPEKKGGFKINID